MPTTKVTRSYQITIPKAVRSRAGVKVGDRLIVEYDDDTHTIKVRPPTRERRTLRLGRSLAVKEIEESIEKGLAGCLRS
ncbi:MAG: AbrB/MazE/SpoVT family DNA-binding domain-containing protein [Candidatus Bathyarchaeia archaeon]